MSHPRRVVIFGATGSIGESAASVARTLPRQMSIVGLSGYHRKEKLLELTSEFSPTAIATNTLESASWIKQHLPQDKKLPSIHHGAEGLIALATLQEAELALIAISGTAGLHPALAALAAGKDLAIASKEILVMAGKQVTTTAKHHKRHILPVDSEHSALFQCLEGRDPASVRRLILTCSGGPFRKAKEKSLLSVTPEMALRHPTWNMGQKTSIDSATLFNKGLEMLEAHWLFDLPMEKIDVVIHPESIIHSMVEFVDGSILAQMSHNSMTLPIQYAVTYPHRLAGPTPYLDLPSLGRLHFEEPRYDVFPALGLARHAGTRGGTMPAVLNAANEAAVALFLQGSISFPDIWKSVALAMETTPFIQDPSLEEIIAADQMARVMVNKTYP